MKPNLIPILEISLFKYMYIRILFYFYFFFFGVTKIVLKYFLHCTKKFFFKNFFCKCNQNPQETADSVIYRTNLKKKTFLCSVGF